MNTSKQFGVTPPISIDLPTPEEQELTQLLLETLQNEGQFESEEEAKVRQVVLGKIDKLVKEFVYRSSLKHKFSEELAAACGGKIFTFGSYRLGAHGSGADIDTLCIAPSHVTREDFFEIMVGLLKTRSEVEELTPVAAAFVPVIKMKFSGVEIDLTFASLQQPTIPEDLELLDTNLLRNLDSATIRSVNGSRVTDEILRLVPNIPSFRLALRCIKLWAKNRAIYSNSLGFFGGVAWAMLVARICQLYPNACAGIVVARFFRIFLRWKWPEPVLLKNIENGPMHLQVWNPNIYPADSLHKMPIITPAYPSMCATHNVSLSTKRIMESEFKRGLVVVEKVMKKEAPWTDLFMKSDFFRRYRFYLQVNIAVTDMDAFHAAHGFLQSKLRLYVVKLEDVPLIVLVHPYVKSIDNTHECGTEQEVEQLKQGAIPSATEVKEGEGEKKKVYTSGFYIGLLLKEKNEEDSGGRRRMDLSWPTQEFIRIVKESESWNKEEMSISISFLRQKQLPDSLFDGEPRDLIRSSTTKKESSNKRREGDNNNKGEESDSQLSKKIKVAAAVSTQGVAVPSTSGVTAKKEEEEEVPKEAVMAGKKEMNGQGLASVVLPPVQPPTKRAGIKVNLLN